MRSRERSSRENRIFFCLEKVAEDYIHGQLGNRVEQRGTVGEHAAPFRVLRQEIRATDPLGLRPALGQGLFLRRWGGIFCHGRRHRSMYRPPSHIAKGSTGSIVPAMHWRILP